MAFLAGLAASIVEWLLNKLFIILGKDYADWQAKRKSDTALVSNQAALQSAIKSGDEQKIEKAGENSLNNIGGN